jgi:hypothetical protein
MRAWALFLMTSVAVLAACSAHHSKGDHGDHLYGGEGGGGITADVALTGVPLDMTPEQLPAQFRTQLRSDVAKSRGIAILRQAGNDVQYTFAWSGLTSPVISGHFHKAPQGNVGARAFSICGVKGESPACPSGTRNSISGVWKNADLAAIQNGEITIAFHTQVYPAPIGELAVYIPAASGRQNTGTGG